MRLTTVHVREYKSIRDSNPFNVGDVTCLVGKNESGKTALLEAVYRLNPVVESHAHFDVTDDYPRAIVEEYRQQVDKGQRTHAVVITATFELNTKEAAAVAGIFGDGTLHTTRLVAARGYENKLTHTLDIDETAAVRGLVSKAQIPDDNAKEAVDTCATIKELLGFLNRKSTEQANAMAQATDTANAIPDPTEKATALDAANALGESEAAKQLRNRLTEYDQTGLQTWIWEKLLKQSFPKFLYFDEYYQMKGHLNIDQLRARQQQNALWDSDRPMLALIELARLQPDELLNLQRTEELLNKLEGASNFLNRQFLKYWSQSKHLAVKFDLRTARPQDPEPMRGGTNLLGRVYDSIHAVTTPLGSRSKGFIWFFSFLAYFTQQKRKPEPIILLLDEPGLTLHASAQGDLLRFIEAELSDHQVLHTTHSPFMIDPQHFDRVRIVEDKSANNNGAPPSDQLGTKVTENVLEASDATLFPLQGALGYDIAQTLFVGPNSLVVEGVSDLLYIQTITGILEEHGKNGLSKEWTITPVGGSDKISTFVSLLGAQRGLRIATLIDLQHKDQQKIERLYKDKLLESKSVLTFAEFTGSAEADIEDMFGIPFYLELVNGEFTKALATPIIEADLPAGGPRLLPRIEQAMKDRGIPFNHYRPARYFAENAAALKARIPQEALDRFEAAFNKLNNML